MTLKDHFKKEHSGLDAQEILEIIKAYLLPFLEPNQSANDLILILVKIVDNQQEATEPSPIGKFRTDLSQLKAVRSFIERICRKAPDQQDSYVSQMQLAINEIFCNIVEHGYEGLEKNGEIIVQAGYGKEGIYFDIADQGAAFNPNHIAEPSLVGDNSRGFGWFIIREIADEIVYVPKSARNGWNHIRLYKKYFSGESQMEFEIDVKSGILVITPKIGTLDARDTPEFKEKVMGLVNEQHCNNIVLNLNHLHFIDSSGLGSFLSVLRNIHSHNGEMKLACMNKPIKTMFELVSMHKIFEIFNTVEDAVQSFQ